MENEKQIYTEVYGVLTKLPYKYTSQIPQEVKTEIYNNIDTKYLSYKIDEILPQSRAFLIEIIRRYFNEKEITEKINEYINFNLKLVEQSKGQYQRDNIFKTEDDYNERKDVMLIEIKKDTIFNRIKNLIKNIFKKT